MESRNKGEELREGTNVLVSAVLAMDRVLVVAECHRTEERGYELLALIYI